MKLSRLVKAKQMLLNNLSTKSITHEISNYIASVNDVIQTVPLSHDVSAVLKEEINLINSLLSREFLEQRPMITQALSTIDQRISEITKDYYTRGYVIGGQIATSRTNVDFERVHRKLNLAVQTKDLVEARIRMYSDWHYPGLEIGPGDGAWTQCLVANEPLYLVDIEPDFLKAAAEQFTPEYQARLRTYLVNWEENETDLSMLPTNQFGFVFSWNVFNYFPLDMIKQYLLQVWSILRPGGVMMFSYNDGENPNSAVNVEHGAMSYVPKTMLVSLVKSLGFEVIELFDADQVVSWIEIKKPGTLHTVKSHQVMGEIRPL